MLFFCHWGLEVLLRYPFMYLYTQWPSLSLSRGMDEMGCWEEGVNTATSHFFWINIISHEASDFSSLITLLQPSSNEGLVWPAFVWGLLEWVCVKVVLLLGVSYDDACLSTYCLQLHKHTLSYVKHNTMSAFLQKGPWMSALRFPVTYLQFSKLI